MKLAYDFDIDDWKSFQRYHYSVSPTYRRTRWRGRMIVPAAMVLLMIVSLKLDGFDLIRESCLLFFAIAWYFLYLRLLDRRVARNIEKFLLEGDTKRLFGPREVELLPES